MNGDQIEAVQNVIDRVSAYQDGAPEATVERELRRGLEVAGIGLDDSQIGTLTSAIEKSPGEVQASDILR